MQKASIVDISLKAAQTILKRDLKKQKICVSWIPNLVTAEQKRARFQCAKCCLKSIQITINGILLQSSEHVGQWAHFLSQNEDIKTRFGLKSLSNDHTLHNGRSV
jgi:hypothetical protein